MSLSLNVGRECNMTQKDLAEAYLAKAQENAIRFKDGNFPNMPLFQGNDIKAAFNAGRESVMENMPELKWECEYPYTAYEARTPITIFHIFHNDDGFHLTGYGLGLSKIFGTLYEAKRFANEEYKKRIKQALGL